EKVLLVKTHSTPGIYAQHVDVVFEAVVASYTWYLLLTSAETLSSDEALIVPLRSLI
ncbi:hypothetical protein BgiMline_002622, partial [Biomphalaria glabrata]